MSNELEKSTDTSFQFKHDNHLQVARRIELAILASAVPAILGLIILGSSDKESKYVSEITPGMISQIALPAVDESVIENKNSQAIEKLNEMLEYMESSGNQTLKDTVKDFKYLLVSNLFYINDWNGQRAKPLRPFEVKLWGGFPALDKSSWRIGLVGSQVVDSEVELAFYFYQAVVKQKLLAEAWNNGARLTEDEIAKIDSRAWVTTMNKAYCPWRDSVNISYFNLFCQELQRVNNRDSLSY